MSFSFISSVSQRQPYGQVLCFLHLRVYENCASNWLMVEFICIEFVFLDSYSERLFVIIIIKENEEGGENTYKMILPVQAGKRRNT